MEVMEPPFRSSRRTFLKVALELEQLCRDMNYWNGLHPEEKPFDTEDSRVAASMARQGVAACDRRDWPAVCRINDRMLRYMEENGFGGTAENTIPHQGEPES
jgi:hypothetical protein